MRDALEDRLQAECYRWFHNTYPNLRGCLCYNLNNSFNSIHGNKNKAMGLQAGRSDMVLYYQGKAYHLELKDTKGSQSKAQREWQTIIEAQGFEYTLHRTVQSFIQRIESIVSG